MQGGSAEATRPVVEILLGQVKHFSGAVHSIDRIVFYFKSDRLRAELARELRLRFDFFRMMGAEDAYFFVCVSFAEHACEQEMQRFLYELTVMRV